MQNVQRRSIPFHFVDVGYEGTMENKSRGIDTDDW